MTHEELEAKVTELNSQIEKHQTILKGVLDNLKPLDARLKEVEESIQKIAELGKQQSEQLANVIGSVNDMGKKMDTPPSRISKASVEQTGKGFETLLEE